MLNVNVVFIIIFFLELKRQRTEPYNLREFDVTVATGAEQQLPMQCTETVDKQIQNYWRNHFYNAIIDTILSHLKLRFSEESQELAQATESFISLDFTNSLYFINHYKV